MNRAQQSILAANQRHFREFSDRDKLPAKPAKNAAVLTCMDHRLDPAQFAGIVEGDAHVIRNAGGRASDDAIRSLVISHKLMGTLEWFVIQHTKCAMCTFSDDEMANLLAKSLEPAQMIDGIWTNSSCGNGSDHGHQMSWLTMVDVFDCVRDDVARIAKHPLVSEAISIFGYVYDVSSGELKPVDGATRPGT